MSAPDDGLRRALEGARGIEVTATGIQPAIDQVITTMPSVLRVTGAGLMVIDGDLSLSAVSWSDEPGRVLEVTQETLGRGPCVDSLVHDEIVTTADLGADGRWPEVAAAVVPLGVRAVVGVPVHVDGDDVGSLNAYRSSAGEWTGEEIDSVVAFAGVLEQLISVAVRAGRHEGLVGQLQQALDSRVVIERAVGLLMGRRSIDAVEAFNLLRAAARRERRRVFELADELLGGRDLR